MRSRLGPHLLGAAKGIKIKSSVWDGKALPDLLGQSQGTEVAFLQKMKVLAKAARALLVLARGCQYWTLFIVKG